MPYKQVHVDSLLRSMTGTVDIGYVARETSPDRSGLSGEISHIQKECPMYFLFTKKVG